MELSKSIEVVNLFDLYKECLTEKQKELFSMYAEADLSLSEIAENLSESRQAVYDVIKNAENTLYKMDDKLKLNYKKKVISDKLSQLKNMILQNESKKEILKVISEFEEMI
ncbi:MAG: sigma factor-like helix-turn-helix DNA-binding protein [Clostridia bacterium]